MIETSKFLLNYILLYYRYINFFYLYYFFFNFFIYTEYYILWLWHSSCCPLRKVSTLHLTDNLSNFIHKTGVYKEVRVICTMGPEEGILVGAAVSLSLLGIPANLLSILLILRAKQPKSTTTYFLFNLAIADIVNLLVSLLAVIFNCKSTPNVKFLWTIATIPTAVANVTLALIALERYNGLVKTMAPFVNMGKGKVKIILGVTWSVCIGYYVPIFAYVTMKDGGTKIFLVFYYTICNLLSYALPLVVVGYCYGKILKGVSHEGTILAQNPANETAMEEKKRFIHIMVVVAVVFMACNLPAVVVKIMVNVDRSSVGGVLSNTLMLLGCISSAVNPYIYGLHSERYHKQVKELLCGKHSETTLALV